MKKFKQNKQRFLPLNYTTKKDFYDVDKYPILCYNSIRIKQQK